MDKFYRRGITKVDWLPAIAGAGAPTALEIAAGTPVTPGLAGLAGFTSSATDIPTPDADTRTTSNVPGDITPEASSLTHYEDQLVDDIEALFEEGTNGFIAIWPKGKATGKPMNVWPVRVAACNPVYDLVGQTAATILTNLSITDEPRKNLVTPTIP